MTRYDHVQKRPYFGIYIKKVTFLQQAMHKNLTLERAGNGHSAVRHVCNHSTVAECATYASEWFTKLCSGFLGYAETEASRAAASPARRVSGECDTERYGHLQQSPG